MVEVEVTYEGKLRCSAKHGPSETVVATDAPTDNGGQGSLFSPTDLVAGALGSCIATIVGLLAQRKGWNIEGMRVCVEKHMSTDAPRRIAALPVVVWMPIRLTTKEQATVERAAMTCPVHQSLHPDIDAQILFCWPDDQ